MLLFDMKEWIVGIIVVVLMFSIALIIIPEGRTEKMVKGVFTTIISLVIVKPIINFDNFIFNFEFNNPPSVVLQENYLQFSFDQKATYYQKYCNNLAKDLGINGIDTTVQYSVSDDYLFTIEGIVVVCDYKNGYLDEYADRLDFLKKEISKNLAIDVDKVKVRESDK